MNNLAFLLADTGGDTQEAFQLVNTAIAKRPTFRNYRTLWRGYRSSGIMSRRRC